MVCNDFMDLMHGVVPTISRPGLGPSMETPLHPLLPHKYVCHVHALNSLVASMQPKLHSQIAALMDGIDWSFIQYCTPVRPLADQVLSVTEANSSFNVFILQNHGILVGHDNAVDAAALIRTVERRLEVLMRKITEWSPRPKLALIKACMDTRYVPAAEHLQILAYDDMAIEALRQGTFFPDQVVFLGPGCLLPEEGEPLEDARSRHKKKRGGAPKLAVLPGKGVAISKGMDHASISIVECVAKIALSIADAKNLLTLSYKDAAELIDSVAERHRKLISK